MPAVSGSEGLIGANGRAQGAIGPDAEGYVNLHGELWRATSSLAVEAGQAVRVIGRNGLTLLVEPSGAARQETVDA